MSVLPYLVAILQVCASAVYLYQHHWRLAIVWVGVGVANAALAGLR